MAVICFFLKASYFGRLPQFLYSGQFSTSKWWCGPMLVMELTVL